MNDPNGLVFHKGRYHLYFQHNPAGVEHANMSWGHASSADLVTWTEHPVAIPADDDGAIFSGSIVVDTENTSGFGTLQNPPLVAVYTLASAGRQAQALAYSLDDGSTWTKFAGNPVLDRNSADFRDPKVFRYQDGATSYWVMVAVEAEARQVVLYRSDDLTRWTHLSTYGPAGAVGGVWECPDLFPLAVDGDAHDVRWVLLISLNPGGVAGGSGTQYVVGRFDGVVFTPDRDVSASASRVADPAGPQSRAELESFDWLDYGRDCYAGVTFAGLPDEDRILIAWMNNWDYAHSVPTSPWRGMMTLARRLALTTADGRPRLRQTPIHRGGVTVVEERQLLVGDADTFRSRLPESGSLELRAVMEPGAQLTIRLRHDFAGDGGVLIAYDPATGRLISDRRAAARGLPHEFATVQHVTLPPSDTIALTIHVDVSSIEIVAGEGLVMLSDLVFTPEEDRWLTISSEGARARIEHVRISDDSM
jgi:sucrose-6-phosphate hydrolase SacC (GH32 family)